MILDLPLEGVHLIEASAGTGKTYTLGLLVLRLILETDLDLRRLVVVTFTEAAASELADRIAAFVRHARSGASEDPLIDQVVARSRAEGGDDAVRQRLEKAELTLDQARITTIHGFCSRLLTEFAFELRSGLGYEHLDSEDELVGEVLADFWREHIQPLSGDLQRHAASLDPDTLSQHFRALRNFPSLPVKGPVLNAGLAAQSARAWEALGLQWQSDREQLGALFQNAEAYKLRKDRNPLKNLQTFWDEAEADLAAGEVTSDFVAAFSQSKLSSIASKGGAPLPPLGILSAIDAFRDQYLKPLQLVVPALLKQAWDYLQHELPQRKARLRLRSNDDLISGVARGLELGGERAVRAIRSRFRAVLVDEFQDTDPVQYRIFQTLFGQGVFFTLVGDPKQAIYGFRGGDIEAYLQAARSVPPERVHRLGVNFRSEKRLLDALGRVYAGVPHDIGAFRNPDIRYQEVTAGKAIAPLSLGSQMLPPITLWHDASQKSPVLEVIGERIAREIFRLKSTGQLENPDFAILVSSHDAGRALRAELARHGLLAVNGKSGSVLLSPEADELLAFLEAVTNPADLGRVKTLLLTPLYGFGDTRLQTWEEDAAQVSATWAGLKTWRQRWESHGLAVVLDGFLQERGVWAAAAQGNAQALRHQRRVTNFRHLTEILHAEDERLGRHCVRTLARFRRLIDSGDETTYEQRLEADEGAVRIVTMHKAKGLQWPVVFAADLWKDGLVTSAKAPPILRDAAGQRYADFDPAVKEEVELAHKKAVWEERQRLAYVTLTRAERLLYIVTGGVKPESPAQWLLGHQTPLADELGPLLVIEPLSALPDLPPPPPAVVSAPTRAVSRWNPRRSLSPRWTVGSYSALTRELSAHGSPTPAVGDAQGIFAFPRGREAGTALHTVFERVDFQAVKQGRLSSAEAGRVQGWLRSGGISDPAHLETGAALVQTVLSAGLLPDDGEFQLCRLDRSDRAAEVDFHLSAAQEGKPPLTQAALRAALGDTVGAIDARASLSGYLYGLIDLVFRWKDKWYILDWKSNHLGNSAADYGPDALQAAMTDNHYRLQYHLYTVAWCRHLSLSQGPQWDYDQHFGGVLYLFLRGVGSEPGNRSGVFFDKPARAVIEALGGLL